MAKYKVGDKVRLTFHYGSRICIITEVHENRPLYQYTAQKERGQGGQYKLADSQISEKVDSVEVSTLPQGGRSRTGEESGQQYATQMAQLHDGSPDGDRWLVLATTPVGGTIKIRSRGRTVNAKLVEVKPRGQKFVFIAQLPTGGTYKWMLESIVVDSGVVAPGTLGDLLKQCQQLLQRGVPATAAVTLTDGFLHEVEDDDAIEEAISHAEGED